MARSVKRCDRHLTWVYSAVGQRETHGVRCDSTRYICRDSYWQHIHQARCSSPEGITEQEWQVHQVKWHPHLLTHLLLKQLVHGMTRPQNWRKRLTGASQLWQRTTGKRHSCFNPCSLQRRNAVSFQNAMNSMHMKRRRNRLHCLASIFLPAALCLWALKITKFRKKENNNKYIAKMNK